MNGFVDPGMRRERSSPFLYSEQNDRTLKTRVEGDRGFLFASALNRT